MEITIGLAFIAGLVSFISPCVLPLVPAYIGYMGGRLTNTVSSTAHVGVGAGGGNVSTSIPLSLRFNTALHGLFFVAGFTVVFVSIGLLSTAFIQQIGGQNINVLTSMIGRVGGIIIIVFGLHFMGTLPRLFASLRKQQHLLNNPLFSIATAFVTGLIITWGFSGSLTPWASERIMSVTWVPALTLIVLSAFVLWLVVSGAFTKPGQFWNNLLNRIELFLYSDTRMEMQANNTNGYAGSALMGVIFSAGWTPCIGPVYGAVLTMAANGGSVSQAGLLLTAYSLGLGIPFMLTAVTLDGAQGILRNLQRHMNQIKMASGIFLVVIGIAVASGQLQSLSERFAGEFAEFSVGIEESVLELVTGEETSNVAIDTPAENTTVNNATIDLESVPIGLEVGNRAPDFITISDTGETVSLSDYHGQVVLLNFWATWCGPCRIEMPEFQAQYEQRADDGFVILAVNNGEMLEDVQGFREEFGLTFPLLMDEEVEINDEYGVFSYPSTFLLDDNGIIISRNFGALTTAQIDDLVVDALAS